MNAVLSAARSGLSARSVITLLVSIATFTVPRSSLANEVPTLVITGPPGVGFGSAMANAGDTNGDGFDDLIVGAPAYVFPPIDEGRAYLYRGGRPLDGTVDQIFHSPLMSWLGHFGNSVAGVGDVNGDGRSDLLIGSPDDSSSGYGRAYLYFGGSTSAGPDLVLRSDSFGGFGIGVCSIGDVNGDGAPDFAVASVDSFYVYFGGSSLGAVPDAAIRPPRGIFSISAAGDWNRDGYGDIVVGGPGRVYLYLGGPHLAAAPAFAWEGTGYGYVVLSGADLDGDGFPDLAVGSPWVDSPFGTPPPYPGHVYVFSGAKGLHSTPDYVLEDPSGRALFGYSFAAADVDGDGKPDLVVGEPRAYFESPDSVGRAFVFRGGSSFPSAPLLLEDGSPEFGGSVVTCDLTGDHRAEVVVGGADRVSVFDLSAPLPAAVFRSGAGRGVLALTGGGAPLCISLEPLHGSFTAADLDLSSFRLSTPDAGLEIAPIAKPPILGDQNSNGIPDVTFCFSRDDVARLFPDVRGKKSADLVLKGSRMDGRRIEATLSVDVLGVPSKRRVASVAPNPLNPAGALELRLDREGPVLVQIYDASGRRVRTLADGTPLAVGSHRFAIDGRDQEGHALASGVYFYEVRAASGSERGRFAILK